MKKKILFVGLILALVSVFGVNVVNAKKAKEVWPVGCWDNGRCTLEGTTYDGALQTVNL